ncbi:MAG: 50S ribosomal protein L40e [Candidatus Micrarchaeota archaeon]|nr:50S ribosomal protein L40e [Candidatus Micrarchaeota archaeon]
MTKDKLPEAYERMFNRVFVCMKCNARIRADLQRVRLGKVKCRKCKSKSLRPKAKERRG